MKHRTPSPKQHLHLKTHSHNEAQRKDQKHNPKCYECCGDHADINVL